MIYLDHAASTPVDPAVAAGMAAVLADPALQANPSSTHAAGDAARACVEQARAQVAALIGARPAEVIWTSGATEANNLAVIGAARLRAARGRHIVTAASEHASVLAACRELENQGFVVTRLATDAGGIVAPQAVAAALRADTTLVSLMQVNNETGVVQDVAAVGALCRSRGVLFHVDASQAAGREPIDVRSQAVDLLSLSAHKMHGPKGVGALYVRRKPRVRLEAQMHGGGHERGMRSGTLAAHQSVGMGEAFRIAKEEMAAENERIRALRDRFFKQVEHLEELYVNGSMTARVPHNLNLSFNYVEGESLIMALKDLAVSSGSACTSASLEPSYVLRALGRNDELAHSSIRFTFGRFTTEEEVDYAAQKVSEAVTKLRELSPLWDMFKDGVDLSTVEWAAH